MQQALFRSSLVCLPFVLAAVAMSACAAGEIATSGDELNAGADAAPPEGPRGDYVAAEGEEEAEPDPVLPEKTGDGGADAGGDATTPTQPKPDACQVALDKVAFTFDNSTHGFTSKVSDGQTYNWPFNEWTRGTTTKGPGCAAGQCFATNLTKKYAQCARGELISADIDLSACSGKSEVKLVFDHAYDFWSGASGGKTYYDGGVLEISSNGGQTWSVPSGATFPGTVDILGRSGDYKCLAENSFHVDGLKGFVGKQMAMTKAEVTIPAAMRTSKFRVRFSYGSGVSAQTDIAEQSRANTGFGWTIDNLGFTAK